MQAMDTSADNAFEIILMYVSMPVMNDYYVTRKIRSTDSASSDPLIIGVASLIVYDDDMLADSGMDSLLAKPLLISRLKFTLKRYDVGI